MKKLTSIFAILILGVTSVFGQNLGNVPEKPFRVSLQGGPMYSRNENSFAYEYFASPFDLITWQFSGAVGYDFTNAFGIRASLGYTNNNPAAGNVHQTNIGYIRNDGTDDRFFPYTFKSFNGFVDAVLHLKGRYGIRTSFDPQVYAGLGAGYTYNLKASPANEFAPKNDGHIHPWQYQDITDPNFVGGFRLGFIAEYNFTDAIGAFADICGEAYFDRYNGLMPTGRFIDYLRGYAGFPFDLRGHISLGMVFHFSFD